MLIFISELLGTMLLIILGDGVVANVLLNKSGMKGGGSVQITIAWGLAVLLPVIIFADASGALFNPALSISMAVDGTIPWSFVPVYIVGQVVGGFFGGIAVYILFKGQFDATDDPAVKFVAFATRPSVPNALLNFLSEAIGTFILMFSLKGIGNAPGISGRLY